MNQRTPPQPHPGRLTPFAGHAVVVGVTPSQPELVVLTAADLASALGATLYVAYADPTRFSEREHPDGSVDHADLNPDVVDDDAWRQRESEMIASVERTLASHRPAGTSLAEVPWAFRYLAGRPDRALTHLARAVDAAVIVVGTRRPGGGGRLHELLDGPVAVHLSHHQHRPVLVVPTSVVDWRTRLG